MTDFEIYALWKARHSAQPTPAPVGSGSVRFIDYDGAIIRAYTPAEFTELTDLPANPTHEGLTAQGWNWNLAEAKEYVSATGALDIGQMYITDDGKTRLYIEVTDGRLKPQLGLAINGSAIVDWGDNSATDTLTGSDLATVVYQEHTYTAAGDYLISIDVTGEFTFLGDSTNGSQVLTKAGGDSNTNKVYLNGIKSIELGNSVTSIGSNAFQYCNSLASITIPSSVTSIGSYTFRYCYSLTSITIPSSVASISGYTFASCYSLASITIPSSVTSIGSYTFQYCNSLASITIPSSVTSIGSNAFQYCYSLASITIPSSVATINANAFNGCYGLGFIKFERSTPAEVSNENAWGNIPTDCIIYVPEGSLSDYTSANNYPSSSTYAYREY